MSSQPTTPHSRLRQPEAYAAAVLSFDLDTEVRLLENERPWQAAHTAKTLVKHPDLRVVLVALRAGARLKQHETAGRVSIHTLSGHICVRVAGAEANLAAGHLLALDRDVPHEVIAQSDAAFLLTIAWPESEDRPVRPRVQTATIPIKEKAREEGLDKTLADTFPCSDAFSSIPDPRLEMHEDL